MHIIKYAVGLICLFILSESARAQANIETIRRTESKSGWYNNITLSLIYQLGNTDLLRFNSSIQSDYLVDRYHTFGIVSFQQEKQGGKLYTD